MDKETPQVIDLSEGELSEQEGPQSGTPELDQLMLTTEEPLWKFADENPKVYSQAHDTSPDYEHSGSNPLQVLRLSL